MMFSFDPMSSDVEASSSLIATAFRLFRLEDQAKMEPIERRRVQPKPSKVSNVKLLTLGDSGVGKSSLVNAFCGAPEEGPTVGADFRFRMLKHAGKERTQAVKAKA